MKDNFKGEIVDLGIEFSDYFPGFGTAFTPYDYAFVGIGATAVDAYEDAVEQVYSALPNADQYNLPNTDTVDWLVDREEVSDGMEGAFYHIGIRV